VAQTAWRDRCREVVASSGLGYDFVCHVGDIAEFSGPVVINYSTKSCEREQLEKQKGGRVPRE